MLTRKQQGNKLYQSGKFEEAIKEYEVYLEEPHDDQKAVYYNISLCHFKLNNFQASLKACEEAISLDETYAKAYYRKVICQQELQKRESQNTDQRRYGIYYDALMFCEYCDKTQYANQVIEMKKLMKENMKIMSLIQPQQKNKVLEDMFAIQKDNIESTTLLYEEKKKERKNARQEINQIYKILLTTKDKQKISQLKQQIKFLQQEEREKKKEVQEKKKSKEQKKSKELKQSKEQKKQKEQKEQKNQVSVGNTEQKQQQKKSEEEKKSNTKKEEKIEKQDAQNINSVQKEPVSQIKREQQASKNEKQEKVKDQKENKQEINKKEQQKIEEKQEKQQIKTQVKQNSLSNQEQIMNNHNITDEELFKIHFEAYSQKSRDIFSDFANIILNIVRNKEIQLENKKNLLRKIVEKQKQFSIIKSGLTPAERKSLRSEMQLEMIDEQVIQLYIKK